jgi:hypothetical protein
MYALPRCALRQPIRIKAFSLPSSSASQLQNAIRRALSTSPPHLSKAKTIPKSVKAKPVSKPVPTATKPSTTPTAASASPEYHTYDSVLASRSSPTDLYLAPSHTLYTISAYGSAAFCLAYAGINYYTSILHPPPDLATWVPYAFSGVILLMGGFGGWLLLAPARLVRSIRAVPVKERITWSGGAPGKGQRVVERLQRPEVKVEVELRKMFPLPGFPARVMTASPSQLSLSHPLYAPQPMLTSSQKLAIQRMEAEAAEKERNKSILTLPFRQMSTLLFGMFSGMKRVWTRDGFLKLGVKGQSYKLDITGGWALEEGRALDRLCRGKRMS